MNPVKHTGDSFISTNGPGYFIPDIFCCLNVSCGPTIKFKWYLWIRIIEYQHVQTMERVAPWRTSTSSKMSNVNPTKMTLWKQDCNHWRLRTDDATAFLDEKFAIQPLKPELKGSRQPDLWPTILKTTDWSNISSIRMPLTPELNSDERITRKAKGKVYLTYSARFNG